MTVFKLKRSSRVPGFYLKTSVRIRDILVWIRVQGSLPLTNNLAPSRHQQKYFFPCLFAYYFSKVHLHHSSKIKSRKESQTSRNKGFSYYFCLMLEGSGSVSRRYGSGRLRNTAKNQIWKIYFGFKTMHHPQFKKWTAHMCLYHNEN